ncbi:hypothetical protein T492DRAFT_843613 [Pavlovales sp. CCMP2436]|nr:hypothetical protein T492DRAFT_843613 [Pavlovales sp. CCMP2436]
MVEGVRGSSEAGHGPVSDDIEAADGPICFICLETSHENGSPLLGRACGCTAHVHQACLQEYLNSAARRSLRQSERLRCPICAQPYTVPIVLTALVKSRQPCFQWSLVQKGPLAFGIAMLGLGIGLYLGLQRFQADAAFFGIFSTGLGIFIIVWAFCMPHINAQEDPEGDESNLVSVGLPDAGGVQQPPQAGGHGDASGTEVQPAAVDAVVLSSTTELERYEKSTSLGESAN